MTHLTEAQIDRAIGVLLGSAVGDALGAGYEFAAVSPTLVPGMIGGGLGNFAPGEWTDDTSQAVAIAQVAALGPDLRTPEALDAIAQGFMRWFADDPADIGNQTAAVFSRVSRTPSGAEMAAAALDVHNLSGRSAGNGSLMRTGPVVLAYLDDPAGLVEAAMAVSALTHYQDYAQQACALWSLMIRHAVLTGEFPTFDDVAAWMPNAQAWRDRLREDQAPSVFTENAWAVGALQAAWSAITHTPIPEANPADHLSDALTTAIRIGHDTDTVAAIAGALLGARWGMSAVPEEWLSILHGWPGIDAMELERPARAAVRRRAEQVGGSGMAHGWHPSQRGDGTHGDRSTERPKLGEFS